MLKCSITLDFADSQEAELFLLGGRKALERAIGHADRPDVGSAVVSTVVAALDKPAFNPFAKGAAASVPTPLPAPASAVVAVAPTVPVAPPATSAGTPTVEIPPAPQPAAAAVVPAAPVAPSSPAGIVVDADGLPWDSRIHASSGTKGADKPKTKDGKWRQKRGLNDAALKARVEAELRQAMGAPAVAVGGPNAPASVPVPLPPAQDPYLAGITGSLAPISAVPAPPSTTVESPAVVAAPAGEVASGETFPAFMARIGNLMVAGTVTQDRLTSALTAVGLPNVGMLAIRTDLLPAVSAALAAA